MHLNSIQIKETEKIKRLNIINSLSGIKPANLIGTRSLAGQSNLAIFINVVHIGSNPPLIGFVLRPQSPDNTFHTYANLKENGYFTLNHVPPSMVRNAHYTSAKFAAHESEFEKCGFAEEYLEDFYAPFVKESEVKVGLRFVEEIPIKINGTSLIIGEIEHVILPENKLSEEGYLDLSESASGVSGLNTYYKLSKIESFPYARPNEY